MSESTPSVYSDSRIQQRFIEMLQNNGFIAISMRIFANHQSISSALLCTDQTGAALLNICSGISQAISESTLQQVHVKGSFICQIPHRNTIQQHYSHLHSNTLIFISPCVSVCTRVCEELTNCRPW